MIQPVCMSTTETGIKKSSLRRQSIDLKKSGTRILGVGVFSGACGSLAMKVAKDYTGSISQAGALGLCMTIATIFMLSPIFFMKNKTTPNRNDVLA